MELDFFSERKSPMISSNVNPFSFDHLIEESLNTLRDNFQSPNVYIRDNAVSSFGKIVFSFQPPDSILIGEWISRLPLVADEGEKAEVEKMLDYLISK